jgi:hypothetical protein
MLRPGRDPAGFKLRDLFQTLEEQGPAQVSSGPKHNYRGSKGITDGFSKSFQMVSRLSGRPAAGFWSDDTERSDYYPRGSPAQFKKH